MPLGPGYRSLLAASGIGNLGDGIAAVAYPWLATLITRDPFLIGLFAAISRLPWLVAALPAGVLADRHDRRRLIVGASAVQAVLTAVVTLLVLRAEPAGDMALYWGLAALLFAIGVAEVVRDNAAQTLLPAIVPRAALEAANGRLWSVETVANSFLGPPLAGVLIAWAMPLPFAADASFALAALLVARIRIPPAVPRPRAPGRGGVRAGMAWLWRHALFRRLALCLGLLNLLHMMTLTVLVLYAQEVMVLSAGSYGLLLTGGAAGAVAGGLLAPRLIARLGPGAALQSALALLTVTPLTFVAGPPPWLAWLALAVEAYAGMQWNIVTVSLRQRAIPDALLGRVNSVYRFFGWGTMPAGSVLGGLVVALAAGLLPRDLALRLPFLIAALASVALFAAARRWFANPRLAEAEAGTPP